MSSPCLRRSRDGSRALENREPPIIKESYASSARAATRFSCVRFSWCNVTLVHAPHRAPMSSLNSATLPWTQSTLFSGLVQMRYYDRHRGRASLVLGVFRRVRRVLYNDKSGMRSPQRRTTLALLQAFHAQMS
jgi:hypothetical protein